MWHDELVNIPSVTKTHEFVDWKMNDRLEDMIRDIGVQNFAEAVYENMTTDAETSLYPWDAIGFGRDNKHPLFIYKFD